MKSTSAAADSRSRVLGLCTIKHTIVYKEFGQCLQLIIDWVFDNRESEGHDAKKS